MRRGMLRRRRNRDRHDDFGRPPVRSMSADQLHYELVNDACSGVLTPLQRFIDACEKIGEDRGTNAEAAYQEIRAEVRSLGKTMGLLQ